MLKLYYTPNTYALASHIAQSFPQARLAPLDDPFALAQWLEADGVDTAQLPRVLEHRRRMAALPAVQKALAAEV